MHRPYLKLILAYQIVRAHFLKLAEVQPLEERVNES